MSVSAAWLPVERSTVHIESDVDASVALMSVRGDWERPVWHATKTALKNCLAEHPEALILDLSGLDDPGGASVPLWAGAQRSAVLKDPPVQLALCIPPQLPLADRMQCLAAGLYLPVYAKVRQARVAIASRLPLTDRLMLTLAPSPDAPGLARDLVTEACGAWDLPDLLQPSRQVMSELVANAVEHAGTDLTVVVSRRGAGLHLSVADDVPALPQMIRRARLHRGRPTDDRGRGLRAVTAAASAWGALPTSTGKVVWATLQPLGKDRPNALR
jgi:hypothetical protein